MSWDIADQRLSFSGRIYHAGGQRERERETGALDTSACSVPVCSSVNDVLVYVRQLLLSAGLRRVQYIYIIDRHRYLPAAIITHQIHRYVILLSVGP